MVVPNDAEEEARTLKELRARNELRARIRRLEAENRQLRRDDTRPLAWRDVVAIVVWTAVGLACLKLLIDWVGWERFWLSIAALFWLVVFVSWFDSSRRNRANRKNWPPE